MNYIFLSQGLSYFKLGLVDIWRGKKIFFLLIICLCFQEIPMEVFMSEDNDLGIEWINLTVVNICAVFKCIWVDGIFIWLNSSESFFLRWNIIFRNGSLLSHLIWDCIFLAEIKGKCEELFWCIIWKIRNWSWLILNIIKIR